MQESKCGISDSFVVDLIRFVERGAGRDAAGSSHFAGLRGKRARRERRCPFSCFAQKERAPAMPRPCYLSAVQSLGASATDDGSAATEQPFPNTDRDRAIGSAFAARRTRNQSHDVSPVALPPRRTVNRPYTLTDKVNRVLTLVSLPQWKRCGAAMLYGCGEKARELRPVRKMFAVFQGGNLGRHRSRAGRAASWSVRLRCLRRPRRRPGDARVRWST